MNLHVSKPKVDSHFHVFHAGVGQPGARYVPQYNASLGQWQGAARLQGVHRGVLVQPSFLGTDNRVLIDTLKAHPVLLRGVAVVEPHARDPELLALHRVGVRGIRLNLAGGDHDVSAWAHADALWAWMAAHGWHLELHTDPGALPRVLERLPSHLPLVLDHMAKPAAAHATDATVAALAGWAVHAPVHVKLSGAYRLGGVNPTPLARLWVDVLGPHRLLWGSDWPCTNHEPCADYARLLGSLHDWVGPEVAERVLTDNPAALYWA
jgi:predicted TIM-barrel fold metal-dependent hydrolase